jgi:hypothetical protein
MHGHHPTRDSLNSVFPPGFEFSGATAEKPVEMPVESEEKRPKRAVAVRFAPTPVRTVKTHSISCLGNCAGIAVDSTVRRDTVKNFSTPPSASTSGT